MRVLASRLAFFLLLLVFNDTARATMFVYVSNAQDGTISAFRMDEDSGALEDIGRVEAGKMVMPMAANPAGHRLYAAIRAQPYGVASYAIDRRTGELTHLSTAALPDSMPYIAVDRTGRFLLAASYGGNLVSVSPIGPDGLVQGEPLQILPTGRNAHAILPDPSNRFVYVPTLGNDQILQYLFDEDTGQLAPNRPDAVHAEPNAGPRHFTFAPNGRFVFVLNELAGTVTSYAMDRLTGTLSQGQSFPAAPPEAGLVPGRPRGGPPAAGEDRSRWIWAADIQMTPDGRFLYASERTSSTLAVFGVDALTGKLTYKKSVPTEKQPRGFRIDPYGRFLLASGEQSDRLAVYRIDRDSGDLQSLERYAVGAGANWVTIVEGN